VSAAWRLRQGASKADLARSSAPQPPRRARLHSRKEPRRPPCTTLRAVFMTTTTRPRPCWRSRSVKRATTKSGSSTTVGSTRRLVQTRTRSGVSPIYFHHTKYSADRMSRCEVRRGRVRLPRSSFSLAHDVDASSALRIPHVDYPSSRWSIPFKCTLRAERAVRSCLCWRASDR
jgi:hypothetical protein